MSCLKASSAALGWMVVRNVAQSVKAMDWKMVQIAMEVIIIKDTCMNSFGMWGMDLFDERVCGGILHCCRFWFNSIGVEKFLEFPADVCCFVVMAP